MSRISYSRFVRLIATAVCISAGSVMGDTYWQANPATTDNWFDAYAWSDGIPSSNLNADIGNGGEAIISYGAAATGTLQLGYSGYFQSAPYGALAISAGSLGADYIRVGMEGPGLMVQTGGFVNTQELDVNAGSNFNSHGSGIYELSSGQLSADRETIGSTYSSTSGSAQFIQTGGTNSISDEFVIRNASYQLSNGQVIANDFTMANATFLQNSGSVSASEFDLANYSETTASYAINNGGVLSISGSGQITIGKYGTAIFAQTDSICSFGSQSLYIGLNSRSAGSYFLNGNSELYSGSQYIGTYGNATFTQTGGTNNLGGANLNLGSDNSTGTYSLSGSGTILSGDQHINGIFTQTGGMNQLGKATLNIEGGKYYLSGSGSVSAATENISDGLFQQNGGINATSHLTIGSSGQYQMIAGELKINSSLSNDGTFDLQNPLASGGTMPVALLVAPLAITGTGTTIVEQNTSLYTGAIQQNSLMIAGKAQIVPSSSLSSIGSLLLISAGSLDITNNALILSQSTSGASAVATVRAEIGVGYRSGWTGPGIITSTAAGNRVLGIGYAEASALGLTSFAGVSVNPADVLIRYTWVGDANLDGIVNSDDLAMISSAGSTWSSGDFNYDGRVDADDYALFQLGLAEGGSTTLPVPEAGVAAMMLFLLPVQRRNKSAQRQRLVGTGV